MNFIPSFIHRRLAHRPSLVKIVDNVSWLFFDKIIRIGVGLLVGVWGARYIGPEQFGLLNFATAFTGMFGAIAALGLQGIVVRDIVRDPEGAKLTLGTAAVLKFIGGLVSFLLILIAISYMRPDDALARSIVAILGSLMLLKASDIVVFWFESQVQSKYVIWVQSGIFLVFAVIKVGLILQEAPLIAFVWAMLAEAIVIALILMLVMNKCGLMLTCLRISTERAQTLLKESWPLLLSGMVLMVQARIDQIMLGQMIGDAEVGYYSAALRVIEMAAVTSMLMHSSFLPSIISAKKKTQQLYLNRLEAFYKLNDVIALLIMLPIVVFSPLIIKVLFGDAYAPSALIMSIMAARVFFAHIGVSRGIYLLNENLLKFSAATMVVGTFVNVILNYLMIPVYQGVGATIASLISLFITIFALDFCYSKTKQNAKLMFRSIITSFNIVKK